MVAGGDTSLVEVIDTRSEKKCQALPPIPISIEDAFGALIDGKPLICGGKEKFYAEVQVNNIYVKLTTVNVS